MFDYGVVGCGADLWGFYEVRTSSPFLLPLLLYGMLTQRGHRWAHTNRIRQLRLRDGRVTAFESALRARDRERERERDGGERGFGDREVGFEYEYWGGRRRDW